MRILHTSDWHLGQHFMGKSRQAEHAAFCSWLVEQVQVHAVDALILAGDVFDTGAPPSHAREQYNRLVLALRECGTALVVLAGNHDSVAMLGESRELLACLGTQVVLAPGATPEEQLILLSGRDGTPGALLCAVPFLRPRDLLRSEAGQSAADKQQALQQAIAEHYRQLHALACQRRAELGLALPIIASGHLTTVGASASESVREIYVGSLEALPSNAFPPADYIALGHIHRSQQVGGLEHIRYSGSPLALSFDEAGQQKQVLLVDLDDNGLRAVTALPVPCWQPLASVRGTLAELGEAIRALAERGSPECPLWLEVQVSADDYLNDLHSRIAALCEGLPVEVLRIRRERGTAAPALSGESGETLDELDADDVFVRRLQHEQLDADSVQRLQQLYRKVLAQVRDGD